MKFFFSKLVVIFIFFSSCQQDQFPINVKNIESHLEHYQKAYIKINNQRIPIILAKSEQQQSKGLSSIKSENWPNELGMLFFYNKAGMRSFWMPDTYFNLDIIYIDESMKIQAIDRNIPHHPGTHEPPSIWRGKSYYALHVLELKSTHPYLLNIGDKFEISSN